LDTNVAHITCNTHYCELTHVHFEEVQLNSKNVFLTEINYYLIVKFEEVNCLKELIVTGPSYSVCCGDVWLSLTTSISRRPSTSRCSWDFHCSSVNSCWTWRSASASVLRWLTF